MYTYRAVVDPAESSFHYETAWIVRADSMPEAQKRVEDHIKSLWKEPNIRFKMIERLDGEFIPQ
jgi:predicted small metal-binding protein